MNVLCIYFLEILMERHRVMQECFCLHQECHYHADSSTCAERCVCIGVLVWHLTTFRTHHLPLSRMMDKCVCVFKVIRMSKCDIYLVQNIKTGFYQLNSIATHMPLWMLRFCSNAAHFVMKKIIYFSIVTRIHTHCHVTGRPQGVLPMCSKDIGYIKPWVH